MITNRLQEVEVHLTPPSLTIKITAWNPRESTYRGEVIQKMYMYLFLRDLREAPWSTFEGRYIQVPLMTWLGHLL